ncbi:phage tail protein [Streptomyces somaliensis DSM 40738]|uniref:Phage tail protein n=1 Tax=Streptomyces somaliensis (strain ATCC 33201 / DSM 40738 / JCM 12659 / KCTC 9044 / NCTC 11332 / NRRL B-12077 / IP 733) TaxID=1134445 RepID=A0AA44DFG7_STRE0|nr:phage tail protein [Streptomyces somaliensis]MCQ0024189.1 phage tail protein [Streptomyces somaliensis DSM 40738]NKY15161.1 phage tail protein [Streptomyces somaliensis DSM 40738]
MSLVRSLGNAESSLKRFKDQAQAVGRATGELQGRARSSDSELKRIKGSVQGSARELQGLQRSADKAERSLAKAGRTGTTSGDQISQFKKGADNASKGMNGLNKSMKGNFIARLVELFMPLIEKVVDMATRSKTMQKVLQVAFGAVKKVITVVMKAVGPIMTAAGKLIRTVWDGIRKAVTVVVNAVSRVVSTTFNAIKKVITTVMNGVKAVVSSVWNGIKSIILPVVNWIRDVVPRAFTAVKDKLSSIWGGLKDIAGRAFDKIKGAVKGPINAVIGLINGAIGKLNGIKVSIPGWVPLVGGKTFGVSLPRIPLLAQGGVVQPRRGGIHAIVAEAGEAEAVLPLSKLDRLLRHTARAARARSAGRDAGAAHGFRIENYYEASSSDLRETASALLFLSKARG